MLMSGTFQRTEKYQFGAMAAFAHTFVRKMNNYCSNHSVERDRPQAALVVPSASLRLPLTSTLAVQIMVPFGLSHEQFLSRYRRCLDKTAPRFITEIRALLSLAVPATVKDAEVQIFMGDDGLDSPSTWIYFTGENNKVDNSDLSVFPGRSKEIPCGLENMEEFEESYFTDEGFDGLTLAANALKAWVAECWWKAGGWSYPIPVSVVVHDGFGDGKSIALSENR